MTLRDDFLVEGQPSAVTHREFLRGEREREEKRLKRELRGIHVLMREKRRRGDSGGWCSECVEEKRNDEREEQQEKEEERKETRRKVEPRAERGIGGGDSQ